MAYSKDRGDAPMRRRGGRRRRKVCVFCGGEEISYKDARSEERRVGKECRL